MPNPSSPLRIDLDATEATQAAERLSAYKREIIQERWLSTLILSIHLELEACLEILLASTLPVQKVSSSRAHNASFSTKLSRCTDLKLLRPNVLSAVKAVNKLRNELAHRLDNRPTNESIFRFIESVSAMHPISVTDRSGDPGTELRTFEAIKANFSGKEAENLEDFVFFNMMLLRAKLFSQIKALSEASSVGK